MNHLDNFDSSLKKEKIKEFINSLGFDCLSSGFDEENKKEELVFEDGKTTIEICFEGW